MIDLIVNAVMIVGIAVVSVPVLLFAPGKGSDLEGCGRDATASFLVDILAS